MTLNNRITKLERTIGDHHCNCSNTADLSWPGHHPNRHCAAGGGQRLIYQLDHHPRHAEPLLRAVLPLFRRIDEGPNHADLSKLTDDGLRQVREALQALGDVV